MTTRRLLGIGLIGGLAIGAPSAIAKTRTTRPVFVYHCAAPPVMDHIANGMYGLILVEPKQGLPKVEADLVSPPGQSIQTTLVPAGGATMVEFGLEVPGSYTLVDHAIFLVEQGAVGFLQVEGQPRHDLYVSQDDAATCPGCLVHP